jgi:hypothetical protein
MVETLRRLEAGLLASPVNPARTRYYWGHAM